MVRGRVRWISLSLFPLALGQLRPRENREGNLAVILPVDISYNVVLPYISLRDRGCAAARHALVF